MGTHHLDLGDDTDVDASTGSDGEFNCRAQTREPCPQDQDIVSYHLVHLFSSVGWKLLVGMTRPFLTSFPVAIFKKPQ